MAKHAESAKSETLEPKLVQPKPPKAPLPPTTPASPALRPAADLVASLTTSGTPEKNLKPVRELLKEKPDATAEDAYRCLADAEASLGTLRKAGKWAWGDVFEPEAAVLQAPGEEIERLRLELMQTQGRLKRVEAEKLGLMAQVDLLRDQNKDLSRLNATLKIGRSVPDLAVANA